MPRSKFSKTDAIVIRSWPKVIFLYPVMLTCFICGIWMLFVDSAKAQQAAGLIFFLVLALNLLVISFEFSRFKTISLVFFCVAVICLFLLVNQTHDLLPGLKSLIASLKITASPHLYFVLGTYLLVIFAGVWLNTRFNYWVIKSNEILHKEGFLGDVRRYPSPNLKMTKEIGDVFEFLLLGAGRIVLFPASEKQAIVLDHVLRVNSSEQAIQDLLSSLAVEIHSGRAPDEETPPGIGIGD